MVQLRYDASSPTRRSAALIGGAFTQLPTAWTALLLGVDEPARGQHRVLRPGPQYCLSDRGLLEVDVVPSPIDHDVTRSRIMHEQGKLILEAHDMVLPSGDNYRRALKAIEHILGPLL